MIHCAFCGRIYRDQGCASACAGCFLAEACGKSRCPYCGYENPKPLSQRKGWIKRLWQEAAGRMNGPRK